MPSALSGPSRYALLVAIAGALFVSGMRAAKAAAPPNVEQRMDRICNDIPPAIIIEGERRRKTTLSSLMATLHVPGVSVAVIHDGKLAWARGFGVRDARRDPVTAATLFQAGSISKPLTALAALRLVNSGKVDLDADVNGYLRSWKLREGQIAAKRVVTLRELLSHTAGIDVPGFSGYITGDALPSLLQILDGEAPADNDPIRVDTVPNTQWQYSGGGYVIVRQLLEDVTNEPFGNLLQASIFAPSGMTASTFDQPLPAALRSEAAAPYAPNGRPLSTGAKVYPELAPDGLWTTPSDLARYAIQIQHAIAGAPGALITVRTAREMLTPHLGDYGLGVVVGDDPKHPWFTHNGGNYGFPSVFVSYDKGDGAVIMSNGQNGFELEVDLLRSIAQEYAWPDFRPFRHRTVSVGTATLDRYVGAYQISGKTFAVVTRNGSRLFIQTSSRGRQAMYPLSARQFVLQHGVVDYFFNRKDELEVTFASDAHSRVTGFSLKRSGAPSATAAARIEGASAASVVANMAAITRRFELQQPAEGGEATLRQLLEELAAGSTQYPGATADFAQYLASIVPNNRHLFEALGPVVSITFLHVDPTGRDTYHIVFRNGQGDMDLSLDPTRKVDYAAYYAE